MAPWRACRAVEPFTPRSRYGTFGDDDDSVVAGEDEDKTCRLGAVGAKAAPHLLKICVPLKDGWVSDLGF
jgi:hypothetical protein